jgi:hypothetical protein
MRDQRIEGWPALGGVEAGDGLAIGRIGAESVHGLGREGDKASGPKCRCGGFDGGWFRAEDAGVGDNSHISDAIAARIGGFNLRPETSGHACGPGGPSL